MNQEQMFINLFFQSGSAINWDYLTIEHLFFIPIMAIVHLLFYMKIKMIKTDQVYLGVDTKEDLDKVNQILANKSKTEKVRAE